MKDECIRNPEGFARGTSMPPQVCSCASQHWFFNDLARTWLVGLADFKAVCVPHMCATRCMHYFTGRSHTSFVFTALKFEDEPDYKRIRDIMLDAPILNSVTFDWEVRQFYSRCIDLWTELHARATATPRAANKRGVV